MDRAEMIALIMGGIGEPGGVWADLGAGSGNFTHALAELLGAGATIYAVDRDARALAALGRTLPAWSGAAIRPVQADFERPLDLPVLDGVLMANALHFVRDQGTVLAEVARLIRPGGRFLVVEYDVATGLGWTPYPVPFERWKMLATAAGLMTPTLIGRRHSPTTGIDMYAATALKAGYGQ